jgi:hypothetical protein
MTITRGARTGARILVDNLIALGADTGFCRGKAICKCSTRYTTRAGVSGS